jgi:endonuclease/exonuclease/phosphatase family metal-dependent hydrolase
MKFYVFSIAILFVIISASAQYPPQIRIMTYNINAEKHGDGSYSDIIEVISAINPDICGLQKLDSCNSKIPMTY